MTSLLAIGLVMIGTLIGSAGSIFLKKGSTEFNLNIIKQLRNGYVILGVILFVISSVFYIIALKYGELSIIYPLAATQYIWISILAQKYLNEKMNKMKWFGITLIIIGIISINL